MRGALLDKDFVGLVKKRTPPPLFLDHEPDRVSPKGQGIKDSVKTLSNTINVMRAFPHPIALAQKAKLTTPQLAAALDNCYTVFSELSGPKSD